METNAAVSLVRNKPESESSMKENSVEEPSNPMELSNDGHVVRIRQSQVAVGFGEVHVFANSLVCS